MSTAPTSNLNLLLDFVGISGIRDALAAGFQAIDAAIGKVLTGSATYDPASLTTGNGATTTVTVTGAVLGDFVTSVSFNKDLQGIVVTGYVSAPDTVAVRFQNTTGGTIDLASGTLAVRVRKAG